MRQAIVLYPSPFIGHLVSMLELAKLILRRYGQHFSVHLLIPTGSKDAPPAFLHSISQNNPSINFHHFTFQPDGTSVAAFFECISLSTPHAINCLREISKSSKISAFIIDFFCSSALPVSTNDLGIPTYYFFTSGAAALATYFYFPTIHKEITSSFKDMVSTNIRIPGLPNIPATYMPEPILDRNNPVYNEILFFSKQMPKSNGILVNTFDDLEPIAIKAIVDGLCVPDAPTPPIYNLGPLIINGDSSSGENGDAITSSGQHSSLLWLDNQPSESVVFLCFGSRGSFSAEQVAEIANGLEMSGQRFLWVVKKPVEDSKTKQIQVISDGLNLGGIMPEGFIERTKDRGMLVESWAPQMAVLTHAAVGGFVTHCGWNSVLEAVAAGVPMVAWPLYAEQHLNKVAMVEDMKIAIQVEQREGDGFVSGKEVEKRITQLMDSEMGREMREKARKMRDSATAAWGESGSSTRALTELGQIWSQ